MEGFRNIAPLDAQITGNVPGPAPEIQFLEPRQLVVNDDYQRELSRSSLRQIKNMAEGWDWSSFKAPNVARTDDPEIFEVVDGQHTAIAAATNGNIPFLPCLVMDADTLAAKAKGFIGINTNRLALTPVAIYTARVAAQEDEAIAVECAMSEAKVCLLALPPSNGQYMVGDTQAIGTMLTIAKSRGQDRLTLLLKIAVAARAAPVSSGLLKALDIAVPLEMNPEVTNRISTILGGQGVARIEMMAKNRTPHGRRAYETLADMIADYAKLPGKRMGRPPLKRGRPSGLEIAA
ncbi:DUF6551 family protein [uncultured Brevundimonas sp.]|uniref:DUF6551 family protein n=1 Tax=uncultured Brevundimonas sp. TaxID=213418 RepID=UPI0025F875CB|nr:DUF6551 family protein [uncultured Brevundimonas sp.]